jgi:hypothetical protein
MKKVFFVFVFMLFTTLVFGEGTEVNTSEGPYLVSYFYEGRNQGQRQADIAVAWGGKGSKPSAVHWECLNYILRKYQTTTGDTFVVTVTPGWYRSTYMYRFVCEFTSATRYNYWFFEMPNMAAR